MSRWHARCPQPLFGGFGRSIVLLENVTITDNAAVDARSRIVTVLENEALVWFNASTIAGNTGVVELAEGSEALFSATVVAGGAREGCRVDPLARVTSLGDNLEDGSSCGFDHPSDLVDTDPMLGVLAGSGGLPQTLVPLIGSPLIDRDHRGRVAQRRLSSLGLRMIGCFPLPDRHR